MNILAIDTSGVSAGVALMVGEQVAFCATKPLHRTHSAEIMGMIDEALQSRNFTCKDIDLFACVTGPGSFTGVRIGVSTVRGMGHATGKPCIGFHALEALAAGAGEVEGYICPMLDARSHQVYAAAFAPGMPPVRIAEDSAGSLADFLAEGEKLQGNLWFVGDGARAYHEEIQLLGERACFIEGSDAISPAVAAQLAMAQYPAQAVNYLQMMPYYLRAPQAERERLAREQCHDA